MFTMLGKLKNAYGSASDAYGSASRTAKNAIIDRMPIGQQLMRDRKGTIAETADQLEAGILDRLNRNVDARAAERTMSETTSFADAINPTDLKAQDILAENMFRRNRQIAHRTRQGFQFAGNTLTNPVFAVGGTGAAILAMGHAQEQAGVKAYSQAMAQQAGLPPEEAEVVANTAVKQMPMAM